MKKQILTVATTVFITFIILQNAALNTITVNQLKTGYEINIFGASKII